MDEPKQGEEVFSDDVGTAMGRSLSVPGKPRRCLNFSGVVLCGLGDTIGWLPGRKRVKAMWKPFTEGWNIFDFLPIAPLLFWKMGWLWV